jgi:hypothetical protein
MPRSLQYAFAATALTGLSLYLWRIAYSSSDWAVLALIPLAVVIFIGVWPLNFEPWKAHLQLALRHDSPLTTLLTGRIRSAILSLSFTFVAIILLAWQALTAAASDAVIILATFFITGCIYSAGYDLLQRHFHHPFARAFAASLVSWLVALPFTLIVAGYTWAWGSQPGAMLDAGLQEALQIGLANLPERGGWIASILAVPYGYEAAKLWGVVQLYDYPAAGVLFSLDTALFGFVLCRTAIIVTLFVETHVIKVRA